MHWELPLWRFAFSAGYSDWRYFQDVFRAAVIIINDFHLLPCGLREMVFGWMTSGRFDDVSVNRYAWKELPMT